MSTYYGVLYILTFFMHNTIACVSRVMLLFILYIINNTLMSAICNSFFIIHVLWSRLPKTQNFELFDVSQKFNLIQRIENLKITKHFKHCFVKTMLEIFVGLLIIHCPVPHNCNTPECMPSHSVRVLTW